MTQPKIIFVLVIVLVVQGIFPVHNPKVSQIWSIEPSF